MLHFRLSERRVCEFLDVPRSMLRYQYRRGDDAELRAHMREISKQHGRYGCPTIYTILRREGRVVNHKKVHRIYKEEGLSLRLKRRRVRVRGSGVPLAASADKNEIWALDFMSDSFSNGKKFRLLNIIDEGTRQALVMYCNVSIPASEVVRELERTGQKIGFPRAVRSDNGPEFRSKKYKAWAAFRGIEPIYIEPGKPSQNAFIESFNARVRLDCLNLYTWPNLAYARVILSSFQSEYNSKRPHSALDGLTPDEFAVRLATLRLPRSCASLAAPHTKPTTFDTTVSVPLPKV